MSNEGYTLPLNNGGVADVRRALLLVAFLGSTLRYDPEEFQTVLGIAQGRAEPNSPAIESLKGTILTRDGTLSDEDRDIILSAYRVVGDGPTLVSPFKLETHQDRLVVERVEQQINETFKRMLFQQPGEDRSPG